MISESTGQKSNRLISEKSPYLLQHAHNPVDWYPWGLEAFEEAKKKDKPVFLSIGYSSCHWCHVMEKESFEDPEVAGLLNETFVCVKVDREERPDLDAVYMKVCQAITGTGGWPLHILMTPDRKPFFAATYIPKENKFGQVGLKELIPRIKDLWISKRNTLLDAAQQIGDFFRQPEKESAPSANAKELGESTLHRAYTELSRLFDERNGGFGNSPKFPSAHNLAFLLRYWKRTSNSGALRMVEKTLTAMRLGGIYDQLGFGFHRYSTDSMWRVPHFEKMLYDQATLTIAYTEAYQATGKEEYKETASQIMTYVLRDMTDSEGAFYSAEDADSEGREGNFYLWTEQEIKQILTPEEADLAKKVFGVKSNGKSTDLLSKEEDGKNVLFQEKSFVEIASELCVSEKNLLKRLGDIKQKMFAAREKRPRPSKDDKILADWNGLMIAALAKAAQAFERPDYATAAERAANFILRKMRGKEGLLFHRYREGEAAIPGFLDDYMFFVWGLIELYESTFTAGYLDDAVRLTEIAIEKFWDYENGGFHFTANDAEISLMKDKEGRDGAYPSGNSAAALNLVRLARLTGEASFEEKTEQLLRAFFLDLSENPSSSAQLMVALDFAIGPSCEVTIVGDLLDTQTAQMLKSIRSRFLPRTSLSFVPMDAEHLVAGSRAFHGKLAGVGGKATAYVCRNKVCSPPMTDANSVIEMLEK